jgi:uncharacterized protein
MTTHDHTGPRTDALTRIVLRPIASPLPLAILALGIGSMLLTSLQLHWIAASNSPQIAELVLVVVAPLELIGAIFCFLIRDVIMATGFGLLTGSWAATGLLLLSGQPGQRSQALGLLAVVVAAALLVPAIGAGPSKPAGTVIMLVAAVRFAFTGVYQLGAGTAWQTASGIIGVGLVATSLYAATAFALEDARHHPVLPVSRRSTGRWAMSGDLGSQLDALPTEAGVRQES